MKVPTCELEFHYIALCFFCCNKSLHFTCFNLYLLLFQSRAGLSLLGYCYYQLQDFVNASDCYEQLTILHPDIDDYRMYYAQSLYKACLYQEAMKTACVIENPQYSGNVSPVQSL